MENFNFQPYKEKSDKGIIPVEFENAPTEGFVLNKKVGGYSGGWDARQTYCRVWDPRGFEFEITVPNLLFILQETNSIKGKGLEGEFIYAWDKKDLVLLPTSCQEYKSSSVFTDLQNTKVAAKDLVAGYTYKTKKDETLIYLGKFEYFNKSNGFSLAKRFVFVDEKNNFIGLDNISSLSRVIIDSEISTFAELIDKYSKSDYCGMTKGVKINPIEYTKKHNNGRYYADDDYVYATAYKEETPNVFWRYNFYPVVKEGSSSSHYSWGRNYETQGFKLKPISEIKYVDGRLVERKLTAKKSEPVVPLEVINKLGFGQLALTLNSGKKVTIQ